MANKPHGLTGRPSNRGKRPPTVTLPLRIPVALRQALEHEAVSAGVSVTKHITALLSAHCKLSSLPPPPPSPRR